MTTVIIIVLLAALAGWAIYRIVQKSHKGGGCCGDHEETLKRIPVQDRNKSHYPYKYTLAIGGMTCENCAIKVENALNALPDTWAKVDIANKKASLLLKQPADDSAIRKTVRTAGYTVTGISAE